MFDRLSNAGIQMLLTQGCSEMGSKILQPTLSSVKNHHVQSVLELLARCRHFCLLLSIADKCIKRVHVKSQLPFSVRGGPRRYRRMNKQLFALAVKEQSCFSFNHLYMSDVALT